MTNHWEANTLNELTDVVHKTAKEKGWWETPRTPLEIHMLVVSEVAEATEDVRKGNPDFLTDEKEKPCGEAVELADAVIRIMDYFGHKGWDLEQTIKIKMAYNELRAYRHGGKKA